MEAIFEDDVDLGGFFWTMVLVLLLMLTQKSLVYIWRRLGDPESAADQDFIDD